MLTEATVFSSQPDQITFVIQLCLLSLSVGGSGLWMLSKDVVLAELY